MREELDTKAQWRDMVEEVQQLQQSFNARRAEYGEKKQSILSQTAAVQTEVSAGGHGGPPHVDGSDDAFVTAVRDREAAEWRQRVELAKLATKAKVDQGLAYARHAYDDWMDTVRRAAEEDIYTQVEQARAERDDTAHHVEALESTIRRLNDLVMEARNTAAAKADMERAESAAEAARKAQQASRLAAELRHRDDDRPPSVGTTDTDGEAVAELMLDRQRDAAAKLTTVWDKLHTPVEARLAFLWQMEQLLPYSETLHMMWSKQSVGVELAARMEGAEQRRLQLHQQFQHLLVQEAQTDVSSRNVLATRGARVDAGYRSQLEPSIFSPVVPASVAEPRQPRRARAPAPPPLARQALRPNLIQAASKRLNTPGVATDVAPGFAYSPSWDASRVAASPAARAGAGSGAAVSNGAASGASGTGGGGGGGAGAGALIMSAFIPSAHQHKAMSTPLHPLGLPRPRTTSGDEQSMASKSSWASWRSGSSSRTARSSASRSKSSYIDSARRRGLAVSARSISTAPAPAPPPDYTPRDPTPPRAVVTTDPSHDDEFLRSFSQRLQLKVERAKVELRMQHEEEQFLSDLGALREWNSEPDGAP